MRGRAYRRYIEQKKVLKRLSNVRGYWWNFIDANGLHCKYPSISDFIGTIYNFRFKTYTTSKQASKYKEKYSPNKSKRCWRYKGSLKTREENKQLMLSLLKEYGIK